MPNPLRISSLRTRILVLTALPSMLLLAGFLVVTLLTAENAVRRSVQSSLSDAGSVFVKLLVTRRNELMTMASVTARDPRFFATFAVPEEERGAEFGPTMEGIGLDFLRITDADFIEIFDGRGRFVAFVDRHLNTRPSPAAQGRAAIQEALGGTPTPDFYRDETHLVVAAAVPVFISSRIEAIVCLGSFFDRDFVDEVKRLTGAEVSLTHAGSEIASTFPAPSRVDAAGVWPASVPLRLETFDAFGASDAFTTDRGGTEYLAVRVRVHGVDPEDGFDAFLGRELETELQPMVRLSAVLGLAGLVAIAATGLVALWVARRTTGPLSEVVRAAAELEKGNYDHPLVPRGADEVAFLAKSFVDMRQTQRSYVQRLRNLDQMKSNFIALAAHELKTPLTVITAFNEMIVSGTMGQVPEDMREATDLIQQRLWDLNRLVQNILDMSRIEQGLFELRFEPVDLGVVAAEAVDQRRTQRGRHVDLRFTPAAEACHVRADRARLEQVIGQLLDNAVRFTPDGGRVDVRLGVRGDEAALVVQDTGIGITPEEIEWIFEKSPLVADISQHSSGRLQFGSRGLGLGLALCRAIVEGHGGRIVVRSTPGRGSEFTVWMKRQPVEAAVPEPVA